MMTIAFASFKEAVRKKFFILVGILTLVYLALFATIAFYAHQQFEKFGPEGLGMFTFATSFISVVGFYFSSMLVAFLTIMASVGMISSEMESGVIHSVLTRPLKRREYIFGKYAGMAILILLYAGLLYASVVVISLLSGLPPVTALGPAPFLKGLLLFLLQPLAILSLCLWGSVSFKTVINGIFVIAIYILGLIGGIMEQVGALLKNDTLYKLGIFSSLLSPFDVIYRQMLSVIFTTVGITNPLFGANFLSGTVPSQWVTLHVLLYTAGLIVLAARSFEKKDIP